MSSPAPVRVLSLPADHAYVRHLVPVAGDPRVLRLPDPPVAGAPAGQWWPSPALEPAWLRAHAGEFDVVHVHFGVESRTPEQLREFTATLRALGVPLVVTVHDLQNPHLRDHAAQAALLDVLVPAAAAVLTLTAGAAADVRRRWARSAVVVPHPHVVPPDRLGGPRPPRDGLAVGLQAKPRANNDPAAVREELSAAVAALPGARLAPELATRLDDDALWDHLACLDVLVLAYRWGTHSGFVEACADLGTTVVAPRTGHLAEQQAVVGYELGVPGSLTRALRTAATAARVPLDRASRLAQRAHLADVHAATYAEVLRDRVAA